MDSKSLDELATLRAQVEIHDRKIVKTINERMGITKQIGAVKARAKSATSGQRKKAHVYIPSREKLVFEKVVRINQEMNGALPDRAIRAVYREIMSASIAQQRPTTIAYLGPRGSLVQQAALKRFGRSVSYRDMKNVSEVWNAVQERSVDYGVLPLESSQTGPFTDTMDFLARDDANSPVRIYAEIQSFDEIWLASNTPLSKVTEVFVTPLILQGCARWIRDSLGGIRVTTVLNTSRAAERAAKNVAHAALCNSAAADEHGLSLLAQVRYDTTAFSKYIVLSTTSDTRTGDDRTKLVFALKANKPGALYEALGIFNAAKVNLTRISSVPSPTKLWSYLFFVDMDGHETDFNIKSAISFLSNCCQWVRVLGSHPASESIGLAMEAAQQSSAQSRL